MGDPTTAEGKAQLMRQSPLTHADKIKTPLLIVQRANDVRVKKMTGLGAGQMTRGQF
jgi:dipeptidyl aminopeptidase/acylaminoacyl peptidase